MKKKKPEERAVYLSKEKGNDFPLDKKNRPLICKKSGGGDSSIYNAMSSQAGKGKIEVKDDDFEGNVKLKNGGSYLNVEDDFEILNNFKKQKIGKYLGKFKEEGKDENNDNT